MSLHEQILAAKNHSEAMSIELAKKSNVLTQLEQKHQQQEETHSKKVYKYNRNNSITLASVNLKLASLAWITLVEVTGVKFCEIYNLLAFAIIVT